MRKTIEALLCLFVGVVGVLCDHVYVTSVICVLAGIAIVLNHRALVRKHRTDTWKRPSK